ncbi:MAG: rhamnulokinase, partial [Treponema sp.]|nr:rhamnulokinase [Candidatus Treponema scatequi]
MNKTFLAIDIGASSGRHFAGYKTNDKAGLEFEEIFRFPNGMIERNGHLCWELDHLFENFIQGMKECSKKGMIPASVGIDTWGVDFVLLDKNDNIIGDTVAYRDSRTSEMIDKVQKIISEEELYERTGIQKQPFNTIYQLMSIKENNP